MTGWDVIGCSACQTRWLLETANRREQSRVCCPQCGTYRDTDQVKALAHSETKIGAAELRSRIGAIKADEEEVYERFSDEHGQYAEQVDDVEEHLDSHADGSDIDLHPIETDRFADEAEAYLEREERKYEELADEALGQYDDIFADQVDTGFPEWRKKLFWNDVQDGIDQWGQISAADKRLGELVLDDQFPAETAATVTLDADSTLTRPDDPGQFGLWADLFKSPAVQEAFVDGVRRFAEGRTATELLEELEGRGVARSLRGRIMQLAHGATRDDDLADEAEALVRQVIYGDDTTDGLLYLTRRLGTQRLSVDEIAGTAKLVGWTDSDDVDLPTITVQLEEDFREKDSEQRENIVRVLWQLARNCEVVIVGSPINLRWFSVAHDIDREAFNERWIGRRGTASIDERVEEAVEVLGRESNGAQILRQLHSGNSQQMSYQTLMSVLDVSKATISNWSTRREQSLSDMGLVEIIEAGGQNHVEITPAGREAIETVDQETPRQQRLDDVFSDLLHSSDHGRVVPREHGRGEEGDPRRKGTGLAPVGTMSRRQAYGATASAVENGISTVNYPVEKVDDYRCPRIWVDQTGSRVVTSTEYVNLMQYWVSTARSLTADRIFEFALTPDRLDSSDHDFTELFHEHRQVLRSSRCLGYLSDDHETVEDFTDALQDARDDLEELTTRLHNGDFEDEDEFRGTITREALGLAGTMAHIMDLVDVDLVRELRLPTFSSDFDADRWDDLVRTIAIGASIQSRYGQFSAYRQLFENRDEKLKWTIFADVDAEDPAGGMIGSFVLVGNFGGPSSEKRERFVEDLEHRLRKPFEIREDAPEFAVDIPVRAFEFDREQFALATAKMARQKNLRATREAVSVFRLFAATPYDVATALNWLETESQQRDLRISEVRYALSKLPAGRLLPNCTPGARDIIKALLTAEEPLSTGELEEEAGVARSTISRGGAAAGDRLQALGLLENTDDGWRLPLSFRSDAERYEEILPSMIDDTDTMFVRDVFYDVAVELVDDPSRWGDPGDPVCGCWTNLTSDGVPDIRPLLDHWEWLDPWVGILEDVLETESMLTSVDDVSPTQRTVSFGSRPDQLSIRRLQEACG